MPESSCFTGLTNLILFIGDPLAGWCGGSTRSFDELALDCLDQAAHREEQFRADLVVFEEEPELVLEAREQLQGCDAVGLEVAFEDHVAIVDTLGTHAELQSLNQDPLD